MRSFIALLFVVASLVFVRLAAADYPGINARRLQLPSDPAGSLYLEPTPTAGPWVVTAGAWFAYGYRPIVLRDVQGRNIAALVSHQLSSDLSVNVGVGQKLAFGLDMPFLLYQTGEDNPLARTRVPDLPPAQAFGDLGISAKGNLLSYGDLGGFGLSALLRLNVPTGNTASYLGEGRATGEFRLLAEYKLVAMSVQATAGMRLRTQERDVLNRSYGNELPWGLAVVMKPQVLGWDDKGRFTWALELHGATALAISDDAEARGQNRPASVAMLGLSSRYAIRDASILLGVETALTEAYGASPLQIVAGLQWTPRSHDVDHDGVRDDLDQCPELAEDRDGIQDADGCPEMEDHDDDGVGDGDDQCPNDQEDQDGYEDADGCPDPDNDEDGIPDAKDACPNGEGEPNDDPQLTGCPDIDEDGIVDKIDKCAGDAEDMDGYQDADGCPDFDNDQDGVLDSEDRCPNVPMGLNPGWRKGCPLTDRDGDTFDDAVDKCPDEPEIFNGVNDDDGCLDTGGRPLVTIEQRGTEHEIRFSRPVRFKGTREAPTLDPASVPVLRALAFELMRHANWTVAIGVRSRTDQPFEQQAALAQAFVAVEAVRNFTSRDGIAETVGWKAVVLQPGAQANGIGALLLVQPEVPGEPTAVPTLVLDPDAPLPAPSSPAPGAPAPSAPSSPAPSAPPSTPSPSGPAPKVPSPSDSSPQP